MGIYLIQTWHKILLIKKPINNVFERYYLNVELKIKNH